MSLWPLDLTATFRKFTSTTISIFDKQHNYQGHDHLHNWSFHGNKHGNNRFTHHNDHMLFVCWILSLSKLTWQLPELWFALGAIFDACKLDIGNSAVRLHLNLIAQLLASLLSQCYQTTVIQCLVTLVLSSCICVQDVQKWKLRHVHTTHTSWIDVPPHTPCTWLTQIPCHMYRSNHAIPISNCIWQALL